jgi:hypothetical protein
MRLALEQRQLSQVVAIEGQQVERDYDDLVGLARSSFCRTEKSVLPSAAGTTTSPSMMAEAALIRKAS